jgi:hypothetical protein
MKRRQVFAIAVAAFAIAVAAESINEFQRAVLRPALTFVQHGEQ